jgi:ribosomal protein L37AE/L43A
MAMDIVIKSFPDYPCSVCGKDLWAQVGPAAWQCQTCWPVEKYPPGYKAKTRSWRGILNEVARRQDFREFNRHFLLAIRFCPPDLAKELLKECREDIVTLGWEHTQKKWAKFVESPKEGACPVCGCSDWWYRLPSELRGPGGWLCGQCHPKSGVEAKSLAAAKVTGEG